jgi:hypothetical protein
MGQMDKGRIFSGVAASTSQVTPEGVARFVDKFYAKLRELFDADTADLFRMKAARIAESLKLAFRPDRPWQGPAP